MQRRRVQEDGRRGHAYTEQCNSVVAPQLPPPLQRIDISRQRKFQEAGSEPLGSDWGKAEVDGIVGVRAANAASIRQMQSNADPAVAQLRQDLACIEVTAINLPDCEEREELRRAVADLRSKAESFRVSAKLPLTGARAGKVARRQNGRPEEQRIVTALHPGRQQNRKRAPLAQQQQAGQQEAGQQQAGQQEAGQHQAAAGVPFPTLAKKGKPTNKVRERHMGRLACAGAVQRPNAAGIAHLY